MLSVYNMQLRNIGRAKCIVCPTNPALGMATLRSRAPVSSFSITTSASMYEHIHAKISLAQLTVIMRAAGMKGNT